MPATLPNEGDRRPSQRAAPAPVGSYSRGPSDVPLLRETIGESLRRIVERFPQREALVVRHHGYRATYAQPSREIGAAARGLMARGVVKATASGSGRRTATSGS